MKHPYLILLSGLVILLFAIEIFFLYIALTTHTNEDITSNCRKGNKSTTISTTSLKTTTTKTSISTSSTITPSETTTTETAADTTKSSTSPKRPTVPTTPPTKLPTSKETTKSSTGKTTTLLPTSEETSRIITISTTPFTSTSPYSTISDTTTINTKETTLDTTTLPTTSTTLVTNSPTIPYTTPTVPLFTSTISSSTSFPPPTPPPLHPTIPRTTLTSSTTSQSSPITNDSDISSTTNDRDTSSTEVTTKNSTCLTPKFNYVLAKRDAEKGRDCVLANMTIHIKLQHITKEQLLESTLTVPTNAIITGDCTEKTANMTLSWEETAKNQTGEEIREHKTDLQLFSAAVKDGIFICKQSTTIIVEKELSRIDVVISNISLIVFNKCSNGSKKTETICSLCDETIIKILAIIGIVIVSILLVLFVLYIWRMKRKKNFA